MIGPLFGVSLFRDVRPDQPGFQPSFEYVLVCLLVPMVLGLLAALLTGWLGTHGGKGQGGNGA